METKTKKSELNGHVKNGIEKPKKADKVSQEQKTIDLPQMDYREVVFKVVGITPLIVSKFSEKAKTQMLEKQMKTATKGREAKNPEEQYQSSLYKFTDGKRTGFPAVGFKAAMVRAAQQFNIPMTRSRGMFHVMADDENGLIEIKGKHVRRDDMVRLATGVADIRFRGCYQQWSATVAIKYNASQISAEQIAQILNVAGFACGIGEWRPEKSNSGSFGMFKIC